jgi:hypothetical protein
VEEDTKVVVVSRLKRGCDDVEGKSPDDKDNNNYNRLLDYNNNQSHYLANGKHHLNIIGEPLPPQSISIGLGMNGGGGWGRKSQAKKAKFVVTYKEMREFFTLLNEESIREFLKSSVSYLIR